MAYWQHMHASPRHRRLGGRTPRSQSCIVVRVEDSDTASEASSTRTWSSSAATSDISIDPRAHCVEQQRQRDVTRKEIQRVVKHGVRKPDPGGNPRRKARTFEGVTVVTQGKLIVTTWRETSRVWQQPNVRPTAPHLPALQEEEESGFVYCPWYGGLVHDSDPSDYSDIGDRYFAWKNGGDYNLLSNEELIRQRGAQFPEMYACY